MTNQITELKTEIERLKKESDLKTGWISLISHNLKENFSSLLWILDALEKETISKDVFFEMLPQIKRDTERNLQTVTDTGEWLKTQLDTFKPQRSSDFAYELYSKLLKDNENALTSKKIDFLFEGNENLQFETDQFLISFIFNQVLNNAIKYSYPEQSIHFTTSEDKNSICLSIIDFGVGMNQKTLDSLFSFPSPIFKGTDGEVGAGLSLKIVKNFVSLLEGEIEISSSENEGTRVSICLPRIEK